jgi:beta-galactosidase
MLSAVGTLLAQEYDSPEYVSLGREMARSKTVPYPTAEEAQALGAGAVASKFLRPVTKWTRTEEADAVVFTSKYVIPFVWLSRQAILYVDEASGAYEVLINGKKVGYAANAYTPAEFNITKVSKEETNTISIRVLKEHWSQTMECYVQNREPRIGEVYVMSQPMLRVRDVVHTTHVDMRSENALVEVGMVVKTETLNPKKARIHYELIAPDTTVVTNGYKDVTLGMREEDTIKFMANIPYVYTWCADMPVRYRLNIKTQIEGRYVEYQSHMLGFRTVETNEAGDFLINGIKTELFYRDMDPLKITDKDIIAARVLKYNALRFDMGAVPQNVYRMCDSLGMYVIAQVPINTNKSGISRRLGGNPTNNPKWKQAYLDRVETTYRTTRGQACVIGYVMAEDSANGINLYESYLWLKSLEPTRPVLYIQAGGEWNSD